MLPPGGSRVEVGRPPGPPCERHRREGLSRPPSGLSTAHGREPSPPVDDGRRWTRR